MALYLNCVRLSRNTLQKTVVNIDTHSEVTHITARNQTAKERGHTC